MGIRFLCDTCQKRLNVKEKQAGEFCVCPDCESEIQVPLESTIEPAPKRKKKRRSKRRPNVEVDLSPVTAEQVSVELQTLTKSIPRASVFPIASSLAKVIEDEEVVVASTVDVEMPDATTVSVANEVPEVLVVDSVDADSDTDSEEEEHLVSEESTFVEVAQSSEVSEPDPPAEEASEVEHVSENALEPEPESEPEPDDEGEPATLAEARTIESSTLFVKPKFSAGEPVEAGIVPPVKRESATAEGDSDSTSPLLPPTDSAAAFDEMISGNVTDEAEESEETESFLLAKPVAKVGADPLKANPNLVWYLRHKRLGEKGPLKAKQIESMLESGQLRTGYIVWREDWNDWLPAEQVFPELVVKSEPEPAYEIPEELNPHSEVNRKRRSQKRFWMCFNAAAFLLVIVLVYWLTQYGM